ncbi:MAG: hypothetical protein DRQ55_00640 [Planctomycetota bacterium]|nr:MAG: hypothetical protein DRQ55_00640 [Planctomycetota bacterium]
MRILLYSHDSYGLGHLRRSMTLAQALVQELASASVLVVTGSPCATHFAPPPGVEVVKLPSITKDDAGVLVPRTLRAHLDDVLALRRALLGEAFRAFAPELLVVDHRIVGLGEELTGVLEAARRSDVATILGLRDVIDSPEAVAREWSQPAARKALRSSYDRICIYGWPTLFDHRREYPLPAEVVPRVEFTGLVVRNPPRLRIRPLPPSRMSVLVTVGGGQDGGSSIERYMSALELDPPDWDSRILLGPLLCRDVARRVRRRARMLGGVAVHEFKSDVPRLLAESDAVVAMAGYNTTAEILQSGTPAVLLPRLAPRREQLIRAQRLGRLGLVQPLPHATAETLRGALETALARPRRPVSSVPLDGAARFVQVVKELMGASITPIKEAASA